MTATSIRVAGVPEHFNLPWHLGRERGAFARAGIDLQWRTVPQGTGAMCDMLRSGEVDLAVLVTEGAVRDLLTHGYGKVIVNYVDTPLVWGVHVGAGTEVHQRAEVKGLPFAISRPGSGSHLIAMSYAKANGWTPSADDFVVVNDLKGAVERMQAPDPLLFLWERTTTAPLVRNGTFRRVDEYRPAWPCFMVVAGNAALAEYGPHIDVLLRVLRDQAKGLMMKKDGAALVAERQGLDPADAAEWFASVRWNTDGRVDARALHTVADTLHAVGLLDRSFSFEEVQERLVRK